MTEAEWLACPDPQAMLDFLDRKASVRKLRLFPCACSRRLWPALSDKARRSVEVAELFADGQASPQELRDARGPCYSGVRADNSASFAAGTGRRIRREARYALIHAAWSAGWPGWVREIIPEQETVEKAAQARLVRDVFGNPFRHLVIQRDWLRWDRRSIPNLAKPVYEERLLPAGTLDHTRLAVLADALEDAGCSDRDILGHLRDPGPHIRGYWLVDLLLARK
jgi:hypothetical protein